MFVEWLSFEFDFEVWVVCLFGYVFLLGFISFFVVGLDINLYKRLTLGGIMGFWGWFYGID